MSNDRAAPGEPAGDAQPLDVLVRHGVDDVDEGLVAGEQAMPSGEEIAVEGLMAVSPEQGVEFGLRYPRQDRRVGDLVAVEVQDRQDGTVPYRIEELVGVPGGGQRARLGLAVADHARHQEPRVVERGPVGVREGVAQFAAFVDRSGGLGCDMTGDAAREGELPEEAGHAGRVPRDVRVRLGVAALQPGVRDHGGPAVTWSPDTDRVQVPCFHDPVEVRVDQIQSR
jgi:hypothetical protein